MYKYRVFVSYCRGNEEQRGDEAVLDGVVDAFRKLGLTPIWDRLINAGTQFSEEIRNHISTAHLFVPILTDRSQQSPWVQQETGFAMGRNIPILPIAVGDSHLGFLDPIQTVSLAADGGDASEQLSRVDLERIVEPLADLDSVYTEAAYWPEVRAQRISEYANRLSLSGNFVKVRQQAVLSSFCIPDALPTDAIWKRRDGNSARGDYYWHLIRQERRVFDQHIAHAGCALIVYPKIYGLKYIRRHYEKVVEDWGETLLRNRTRLLILGDFLKECISGKYNVDIVASDTFRHGNVTIFGDCWKAESHEARVGRGYYRTMFSWHAATVLRAIQEFDEEFDAARAAEGAYNGPGHVLDLLTSLIRELEDAEAKHHETVSQTGDSFVGEPISAQEAGSGVTLS